MFVVLEGIDACGKTTQADMLAKAMGAELYGFPDYETPMGLLIEGHLKGYWQAQPVSDDEVVPGGVEALNATVFQALQLANRLEHASAIEAKLDLGEHVVTSRYWQSGLIYGRADGLDPVWLRKIQQYLPTPDLNILLDISPAQSVQRRPERRDRYEERDGLMVQLANAYRTLWADEGRESDDWVVVNGRDDIDGVHQQIRAAIDDKLDRVISWHPEQAPVGWRA